jgi:hypothetical protein
MRYCVIRHPDLTQPGTCPETSLEHHESLGWTRVSDWANSPAQFNLAEFAATVAAVELDDATQPSTPAPAPGRAKKKES